jgi:hypothetical protein
VSPEDADRPDRLGLCDESPVDAVDRAGRQQRVNVAARHTCRGRDLSQRENIRDDVRCG